MATDELAAFKLVGAALVMAYVQVGTAGLNAWHQLCTVQFTAAT